MLSCRLRPLCEHDSVVNGLLYEPCLQREYLRMGWLALNYDIRGQCHVKWTALGPPATPLKISTRRAIEYCKWYYFKLQASLESPKARFTLPQSWRAMLLPRPVALLVHPFDSGGKERKGKGERNLHRSLVKLCPCFIGQYKDVGIDVQELSLKRRFGYYRSDHQTIEHFSTPKEHLRTIVRLRGRKTITFCHQKAVQSQRILTQ